MEPRTTEWTFAFHIILSSMWQWMIGNKLISLSNQSNIYLQGWRIAPISVSISGPRHTQLSSNQIRCLGKITYFKFYIQGSDGTFALTAIYHDTATRRTRYRDINRQALSSPLSPAKFVLIGQFYLTLISRSKKHRNHNHIFFFRSPRGVLLARWTFRLLPTCSVPLGLFVLIVF